MERSTQDAFDTIKGRFLTALAPFVGRVTYGNLRHEISRWEEGGKNLINLAVIYETPGGSTNQLNILYDDARGVFALVDGDSLTEVQTTDLQEALDFLERTIRTIPERRKERLKANIQQWYSQGKSRVELLAEINKLVKTDFKGGSITHLELKEGIQYCLRLFGITPPQEGE